MAASLASKATLVTLPVLLLLCDFWPLGRIDGLRPAAGERDAPPATPRPTVSLRHAVLEKLPLMAVAILATAITVFAQGGALEGNARRSLIAQRLPNAVFAVGWYLWRLLVPVNLCPYYAPIAPSRDALLIATSAAAILAVMAVAAVSIKKQPAIAWGAAWFFLALAPVLQIVQTGSHGYADRYSYAAHIGLVVAVVFPLAAVARHRAIPAGLIVSLSAAIALALGATSIRQIGIWQDAGTLWRHTLAVDGSNGIAMYTLGTYLLESGDPDAAIEMLERAANFCVDGTSPGRIDQQIGLAHLDARRPADAARAFEAALAKEPGNCRAINGLGVSWLNRGAPQRALDCFDEVRRLRPDEPDAVHNAMLALVALGRLDDAATACRRLSALNPAAAEPRSRLGQILLKLGRAKEAICELEAALQLDPANIGVKTVLAEAYAADGRREQARAVARDALAAARGPLPETLLQRLERVAADAVPDPER